MIKNYYQKFKLKFRKKLKFEKEYKKNNNYIYKYLGSAYGGKYIALDDSLNESLLLSFGAGLDISFDVEFINNFNSNLIISDPTPKSISYLSKVSTSFGNKKTIAYERNGIQPVGSYDLLKLNSENCICFPFGIWNEHSFQKFFLPKNIDHVSGSIDNCRKGGLSESYIDIECKDISFFIDYALTNNLITNLEKNLIIKLDIEGAECRVINDIINRGIYPYQLLVEYDNLNYFDDESKLEIQKTHDLLLENNYNLALRWGPSDFLYIRNV